MREERVCECGGADKESGQASPDGSQTLDVDFRQANI